MGFKNTVLKGSFWIALFRILTRIISVAKAIVIARLLGPFELGTFALSSITLAFLEIVTETGINVTLLQEDEKSDKLINSAWIVSIFRGILLSLFIILLSFILPGFFKNGNLRGLLLLTAVVPLIRGFLNPSIVNLQKNMLYKKDFQIRTFLFSIDAFVSIIFAVILKNAYCIVIGQIVFAFVELIISWISFSPRPKWIYEKDKFMLIIGRGKWVTLSGIFDYLFHNFDDLVIGKVMGSYFLGMYNTIYRVAILPITESGEVISKVTLPVLIKISGDRVRLKKAFDKTSGLMMIAIIPATILAVIFADKILLIFLGRQWLEAADTLRVLLIHGTIRAVSGYTSVLFLAVKKQLYVTVVTFASMAILLISIVPLVSRYGILGGGISSLLGTLASIPIMFAGYKKVFKTS